MLRNEYYYLGTKSGRDEDKFAALNLEWEEGSVVSAPLVSGCPVSVECKVAGSFLSGDHEFFFGTVEAVHVEESCLNEEGGIDWSKVDLL